MPSQNEVKSRVPRRIKGQQALKKGNRISRKDAVQPKKSIDIENKLHNNAQRDIGKILQKKYYTLFEFNKDQIINLLEKDGFDQMITYWEENKSVVPIKTITPFIDDDKFIDLVAKLKINFISQDEPELSQKVCNLIHKASKKQYGNLKIGEDRIKEAEKFASKIGPLFDEMKRIKIKSLSAKAKALNDFGIKTFRGKEWNTTTVKRTLERWQKLKNEEENTSTPKTKTLKPE